MASPKVFVSSTCYDLAQIRHNMHSLLTGFGYEPVMSEYSDVLFDPRQHTHTNCIQDVKHADIVVLFIGSRFGGKAIPEAISLIDWEAARRNSKSSSIFESKESLSITQLEVISAIESGIPVFPFVEERVHYDHLVYEKNKENFELIESMTFPSIEKKDSAKFIFEFINFLRHRTSNNAVIPFSKFEEIESHLKKQWASLFQRLLSETISQKKDELRRDVLLEKIENLETAVISTIKDDKTKSVARNTMRFRRLIDFLLQINMGNHREVFHKFNDDFDSLLQEIGIVETVDINDFEGPWKTAFIKEDRTYFGYRVPIRVITALSNEWMNFISLKEDERKLIAETISEQDDDNPFRSVRYYPAKFESDYPQERIKSFDDDDDEIPF